MTSSIKNLVGILLLFVMLHSCNQGQSLQRYYVDSQEQPNFLSVDVPVSILNLDQAHLNRDQEEAYRSIHKLNLLAYKIKSDNLLEYESEVEKVKEILNQPKYEELMRGGNSQNGQFIIKILGKEDDIEEFILFGNATNRGFAIVRILGDDMNANKIMSLSSVLDKANIDDSKISQFTEFFK